MRYSKNVSLKMPKHGEFDLELWDMWKALNIPVHCLYMADLELILFGRERAKARLKAYAEDYREQ